MNITTNNNEYDIDNRTVEVLMYKTEEYHCEFASIEIKESFRNNKTGTLEIRIHKIPADLHFLDELRYAVDEAIRWARS